MKYKYNKVLLVIFFAIFFTLIIFSLEIPKNDFRFFLATSNDKFS
jgi:hypothetical protein